VSNPVVAKRRPRAATVEKWRFSTDRRRFAAASPGSAAADRLELGLHGSARARRSVGQGESIMAGSVNKVILVGNLGKDPRVSRTNSGDQVVNFSLATSETWRDKTSGERKERTEWHNIVVFNENIGRVVEQYCKKGTKVYVEGQLQTRKWTDQSGVEKYTTEVVLQRFRGELVLLDSRGAGGEGRDSFPSEERAPSVGRSSPVESKRPALSGGGGDLDDDIPF
jgi:single-strand DNA-binding protein